MWDFSITIININLYSLIKSNNNTIAFYYKLISNAHVMNKDNLFEQGYIKKELKNYKNLISVKELPLNQFPSGLDIFVKSHSIFYDEAKCIYILLIYFSIVSKEFIAIHFTYIFSLKAKIYKQKELLMYNIDENHYYSSTINKYITVSYNLNGTDIKYDRNILILLFSLAIKTNRIFILPKFNCKNSLSFKKLVNRHCSFDDLFDISALDKYLLKHYRENVYTLFFY